MDVFPQKKPELRKHFIFEEKGDFSKEDLENKIVIGVLKDLKDQVENLSNKISLIEKKLESIPHNTISSLYEYYQDGETTTETDFYSEIAKINSKLTELEKKLEERIPEKVLSESSFRGEVQDSEELIKKIVSEMKTLIPKNTNIKEPLTIVETKRIENITSLLERHEKLTSSDLSQLIGLSRTRCNEYFKLMEKLGIVETILGGREKFYRLKA